MLRKKKGIQMEELLTTLEDARVEASPERANETKTVQELVKTVIRNLPDRYRDCLFLSLIDEYTPKEIACILEMKEYVIYKRLQRGKKMLQNSLTDLGVTTRQKHKIYEVNLDTKKRVRLKLPFYIMD